MIPIGTFIPRDSFKASWICEVDADRAVEVALFSTGQVRITTRTRLSLNPKPLYMSVEAVEALYETLREVLHYHVSEESS